MENQVRKGPEGENKQEVSHDLIILCVSFTLKIVLSVVYVKLQPYIGLS